MLAEREDEDGASHRAAAGPALGSGTLGQDGVFWGSPSRCSERRTSVPYVMGKGWRFGVLFFPPGRRKEHFIKSICELGPTQLPPPNNRQKPLVAFFFPPLFIFWTVPAFSEPLLVPSVTTQQPSPVPGQVGALWGSWRSDERLPQPSQHLFPLLTPNNRAHRSG